MKLAHFSDTHLGYRAYEALSPHGNNQREADVISAFRQSVRGIGAWEPDLVIHAGDVADAARIDHRIMLVAKRGLTELTAGGERPVVVIAGNHDAPRSRKDVCFLELFDDIPGLHIVTQGYEQVDLGDTVVHAIPHDSLKTVDMADVRPVKGKRNILTSHGVAEASGLFLRAVGREFPIPADVLLRDWDYVALGHWHKRGPVVLGSEKDSRIWYAGSTENISFRDLRDDDGMARGWLRVEMGGGLQVNPVDVQIRRMFRLPALEGEGLAPDEVTEALLERLDGADLGGAVVGQVVSGVPRDVWSLVDQVKVRNEAGRALHYQITVRPVKADPSKSSSAEGAGLGQVDDLLEELLEDVEDPELRTEAGKLASQLLSDAMGESADEETEESQQASDSGEDTEKSADEAGTADTGDTEDPAAVAAEDGEASEDGAEVAA